MNKIAKNTLVAVVAMTAIASTSLWAVPPTNFTYQGQLKRRDVPVNGELSFLFTLWDAVEGGREVARGVELGRVKVINGLFEVELDFGIRL